MRQHSLVLLSLLLAAVPLCSASDITYYVNESFGNGAFVNGYITTNGTIGVFNMYDPIVAWNLVASNGIDPTFTLYTFESVFLTGNDLSATPTHLYFNFSGAPGGLYFASPDGQICWTAQEGCFNVVTGLSVWKGGYQATEDLSGSYPIATASAITPEPGSWALLGTALMSAFCATKRKLIPRVAGGPPRQLTDRNKLT